MSASIENYYSCGNLTGSNVHLTGNGSRKTIKEKLKSVTKLFKNILLETTVEPCLFLYMLSTALSSVAVQNMHLEKSCRVNLHYSVDVCDRIAQRNTTGLEMEQKEVQALVAKTIAWKFPLQTSIPAVLVLFVGAWSDKHKKRKICILFPMLGEILANIGLILATYYFYEVSLISTALIEALPAGLTGSYIIMFMGMYSFMADRTSSENRTFRMGVASIFISLGTPTGTALSGILLKFLGYYGIFSLLLFLHTTSFVYGFLKLEDVFPMDEVKTSERNDIENRFKKKLKELFGPVSSTFKVALKSREFGERKQIISVLLLYLIMVGPLYGDSQVSYLYAIRKFCIKEVEYTLYGTLNIILGLFGTMFCITVLSKKYHVHDSFIGCLAGCSRIVGCFVLAFAPDRIWYYSAAVFNIFSYTGLTAVRSIASKSVPADEVAKLNSLLGVMEAIAPSIYMPTSSFIYVAAFDYLPGAFYLFDAALTLIALALFEFIYHLAQRRMELRSLTTNSNEHYYPKMKF